MATNIKRHTQYYSGNGVPKSGDAFYSLNLYSHYFDRDTKKYYIYMGSGSWIIDPEFQPSTGSVPAVTIGSTTTLPAGSQATVTDADPSSNVVLNFGIPQGQPGASGSGGSGVSIVVVPNGVDDTANLQSAIQQAKATGRPIELYGTYFISSGLTLDKDHYYLTIKGNQAKIKAKNQNAFTFIKRTPPADQNEALGGMYQAWYIIENLRFEGFNSQKGLEPGPCGGSEFNNLRFDGLGMGIELRFALNATIKHPYFINCVNGAYIGCGNWTGADNANSQSNRTKVYDAECYMPSNGNVAIGVYNCSGVELRGTTIEGFKVVNGVEFISDSTVVKDFLLYDTHFECVQGASGAFFKGRILGGTMKVEKAFGQYASMFMDVASTSGLAYCEVGNVDWWVGQGGSGNGNGKVFTTNNISVHFDKCEAWGDFNSSLWVTPQQKCGDGSEGQSFCGYNRYTFTKTPR